VHPLVPGGLALVPELRGSERAIKDGVFGGVDPLVLRQRAGIPEPLLAVRAHRRVPSPRVLPR